MMSDFDYDEYEEPDADLFIFRLKNEPEAERRRNAAWQLGRIRDDKRVLPALLDAMTDDDEGVRVRVAEALGAQKDTSAIKGLITLLTDTDPEVRSQAVQSLAYQGDADVIDHILPLLQDDNVRVRMMVADAAGKLQSERAADALLARFLDDDSREVQHFAAESLKAIGGQQVLSELLDTLQQQDTPGIIQELLEIIAALQNPSALSTVQRFTNHDDTGVRETAKWAISVLGKYA